MKRALSLVTSALIVGSVTCGLAKALLPFIAAADSALFEKLRSDWFSVIHFSHNAFFQWRHETLLLKSVDALSQLVGISYSASDLICLNIGILGFCLYLFLGILGYSALKGILAALFLCALILWLFGFDTVMVATLAWFPLYLAALYLLCCREGHRVWHAAFFLLVSVILSVSAHSYALLLAVLGLLGFLGFEQVTKPQARQSQPPMGVLLFGLALPLLAAICYPAPKFPLYPWRSHVIPDDGVAGILRPLIGPDIPLAVIDTSAIVQLYGPFSLWATLVVFLVWLLLWSSGLSGRFLKLALGCAVLVVLETALPPSLLQVMPLSSAARVVPGLFFFPLAPLFLGVMLFFLVLALAVFDGSKGRCFVGWMLGAALFISPFARDFKVGEVFRFPLLQIKGADVAYHQVLGGVVPNELRKRELDNKILISPSYYMVREFGAGILELRARLDKLRAVSIKDLASEVRFSHFSTQKSISKVSDGNLHTRWASKKGAQLGDEWFSLRFREPLELDGIELATGDYTTDFPRGVRVSYAAECDQNVDASQSTVWNLAYEAISWQGSIHFTASGHPYHGGQAEVRIVFNKPIVARCVLVEQIGKEKTFDWSVAEVFLLQRDSN